MHKDERTTIVFGEVLKELRQRKSYSQEFLGRSAGFGRNYVALLEKGERGPSIHTMLSLARALDLPFWELAKIFEERLEAATRS